MGDHPLYVLFPDGTIRYGVYQSTSDIAFGDIVDDFETATGPDYYANRRRWDDVPTGPGAPVTIATMYGGGFWWHGTATPDYILTGRDPWEDGRSPTDGVLAWVSALAEDDDDD